MKMPSPELLRSEANDLLSEANMEININDNFDPKLTCMNCKHSIIKYMNSYLISHNVQPNKYQVMAVLLDQCRGIDPNFEYVDLSAINCRFERVNEDHCTDRVTLNKCVDTTSTVMAFTRLDSA